MPSSPGLPRRFANLWNRTACPYAEAAQVVFGPEASRGVSPVAQAKKCADQLQRVLSGPKATKFDMFVIELREIEAVKSIPTLAAALRQTLEVFARRGPEAQQDPFSGILSPTWDFVFCGQRFFVPVFAPLYPQSHPRSSQARDSAFILMQPDICFTRKGISSKSPGRANVSQEVMRHFVERGFSYDLRLVTHPLKAARYVKPMEAGQDPVKWWEATNQSA